MSNRCGGFSPLRAATAAAASVVLAANIGAAQTTPPRPGTPPATPAAAPPAAQQQRPRGIVTMSLTTSAFADGGMIPAKHAQQGRDVSPALAWTGAPDSTRTFVLMMHDTDAALGTGLDDTLHWLVWNIPGTATSLAEMMPQGGQQANGIRQISASGPYYRGPAAPSTGPAHHYVFELYALDANINVAAVGMSPAATRAAITDAMAGHVRGKGVLVGLYRRPAP